MNTTFFIFLLGSIFLPISTYGPGLGDSDYFLEVLGNVLPGIWLNRAIGVGILVGTSGLVLALRGGSPRFGLLRPNLLDIPIIAWVGSPTVCGIFNDSPLLADIGQSFYLFVVWGLPYAVARFNCREIQQVNELLKIIFAVGILTFILALSEFVLGRFLYATFYGDHPFQTEGEIRYFGFRPLLFFEDANQIGMWWMTLALTSLAVFRIERHLGKEKWWRLGGVLPVFLFQSAGGAMLTVFGGALLFIRSRRVILFSLGSVFLLLTLAFVFRGPILDIGRRFGDNTAIGAKLKDALRATSLHSLSWRFGLEEDNYKLLLARPIFGWGTAEFWRVGSESTRPWGLMTLIAGSYGLLGFLAWLSIFIIPILACLLQIWHSRKSTVGDLGSREKIYAFLAVLLSCHLIDAGLNSAFLLPIIMLVGCLNGSLAVQFQHKRQLGN